MEANVMIDNYRSDAENDYQQSYQPSSTPIVRMNAHQYEKKIQELLEKIDILESRMKVATDQKVKVVQKLKSIEEENDMLKEQVSRQNEANRKLNTDKASFANQIELLETSNKALNDKTKTKFEILNKELDDKEGALDSLMQQLKAKDEAIKYHTVNNEMIQKYSTTYKDDLEEQKKINQRQIGKITELEKQIDALYINKKSEGVLLLEIEHLKDDNVRLLQMLKSTEEFKDFAYLSETTPGGIRYIKDTIGKKPYGINIQAQQGGSSSMTNTAKKRAMTSKGKESLATPSNSANSKFDNTKWVPAEIYEFAMSFKTKHNLDMSDTYINELLASLNKIWRDREQKQIASVKSRYQSEIMGLRRKLAMKSGYDEFTAGKQISKLKKDLKQTRDDLRDNIVLNNKLKTAPCGLDLVDNALKVASTFQNTKKCLENEIGHLKRQIAEKEEKYSGDHKQFNQGSFWMVSRSYEEIEQLEKNIDELYEEYEERVKNSNLLSGQNDLLDFNVRVINNAVKWFFNALKEMISDIKEKFSQWKYDTQKNLDVMKY